jgi:uncharacterized protein YcaQ
VRTISVAALRRLLVTAQGYVPRVRRAGAEEVESAIRRASCIQLDSISTVERSHRIAIATRAGVYPPGTAVEQHDQIVVLCASGQAEAAARAVRENWLSLGALIEQTFEQEDS